MYYVLQDSCYIIQTMHFIIHIIFYISYFLITLYYIYHVCHVHTSFKLFPNNMPHTHSYMVFIELNELGFVFLFRFWPLGLSYQDYQTSQQYLRRTYPLKIHIFRSRSKTNNSLFIGSSSFFYIYHFSLFVYMYPTSLLCNNSTANV